MGWEYINNNWHYVNVTQENTNKDADDFIGNL